MDTGFKEEMSACIFPPRGDRTSLSVSLPCAPGPQPGVSRPQPSACSVHASMGESRPGRKLTNIKDSPKQQRQLPLEEHWREIINPARQKAAPHQTWTSGWRLIVSLNCDTASPQSLPFAEYTQQPKQACFLPNPRY